MLTAPMYLKKYKAFSFLDLYQNGEKGAVFVPSMGPVFTSSAETTPAYNDGDAVGRVYDLTGRFSCTQSTGTSQPLLKVENGTKYLSYDGGDSLPVTTLSAINWRADCDAFTVALAFRVPSTGSTQNLFWISDATSSNNALIGIQTSSSSGQINIQNRRANGDTVLTRSNLGPDIRDVDSILVVEQDFLSGIVTAWLAPEARTISVGGTPMNGSSGRSDSSVPLQAAPLGRQTGSLGNTSRMYASLCISRKLSDGERVKVVQKFQEIIGARV